MTFEYMNQLSLYGKPSQWKVHLVDEVFKGADFRFLADCQPNNPVAVYSMSNALLAICYTEALSEMVKKAIIQKSPADLPEIFVKFRYAMPSHYQNSIEVNCYARVGILGNPSDGYAGKTISSTVNNFKATVRLKPSEQINFEHNSEGDRTGFNDLEDLSQYVTKNGYDGGIKLLMATTKLFYTALKEEKIILPTVSRRCFSMSYATDVPRQLGLAGSSAICTAAFRALMAWYGVGESMIPPSRLSNYVLRAEQQELGITAGLQDRVSQAFDELVYMDFTPDAFERHGNLHGNYEPLGLDSIKFLDGKLFLLLPSENAKEKFESLGKSSGKVHSPVRKLWEQGDSFVRSNMSEIASIADKGKIAIMAKDDAYLVELMNTNFAKRLEMFGDAVSRRDRELISIARSFGPDIGAKLPGSGGAVLIFAPRASDFEAFIKGRDDVIATKLSLRLPSRANL